MNGRAPALRRPPGLLAALDRIRAGTPTVASSSVTTDHVWLVPPSTVDAEVGAVVPAAPLDLRIDALGEL